ncbi:glycosyltransferase [Salipiger mucosus]|uniref:glycosyltransferase n=1 Tax=Salipiger mucosus TaxID=263378 RepID=UPI0018DBF40F|nr:glycosyltransferase [Salipiger mucosus]
MVNTNSHSDLAPIAIFAFNRPGSAKRLVRSLESNPEFSESKVFVFIDGSRSRSEQSLVDSVEEVFQSVCHPRICIVRRDENYGLKKSLSCGIDVVCQNHDSVVVLEDDLELSQDALKYFNLGLNRYREDMRVWSICADVPDVNGFGSGVAHFLPVGSSWGWATWSNRWENFSAQANLSRCARTSRGFRDRFNGHGLRRFDKMLSMEEQGFISSWYVHWQLAITKYGGLSLFPPEPMVRNMGFSAGTHSSKFSLPSLFGVREKSLSKMNFTLPSQVEIDFEFGQRVIDSREWRLYRFNSVLGRIKRRIRRVRR